MSPDNLLTFVIVMVNLAMAYAVIRLAWWAFRKFVSGTGKAWRGEP
jgi:hypothetical protein